MLLTKMRPSERFVVFAGRPVHDELVVLFTVMYGPKLARVKLMPPGLDVWREVEFVCSDDVPAGAIVFASRAAFTHETIDEWRQKAWLVEITNVYVPVPGGIPQ